MNTGDSSGHFTGSNMQDIRDHVYELTGELRTTLRPPPTHRSSRG
jgi:hypothetical protein